MRLPGHIWSLMKEYRRNRRHIHPIKEPLISINNDLNDDSKPVTTQSNIDFPNVTVESDGVSEPDPPDSGVLSGQRCSIRVRSAPSWQEDYVMLCYVMLCYVMLCYVMLCYVMLCYKSCYSRLSTVEL